MRTLQPKFLKFFVCPLRDVTTEEAGLVVTRRNESDLNTGRDTDCPYWDFACIFSVRSCVTLGYCLKQATTASLKLFAFHRTPALQRSAVWGAEDLVCHLQIHKKEDKCVLNLNCRCYNGVYWCCTRYKTSSRKCMYNAYIFGSLSTILVRAVHIKCYCYSVSFPCSPCQNWSIYHTAGWTFIFPAISQSPVLSAILSQPFIPRGHL